MESWLEVAQVEACRNGRVEYVARLSEGDEGTCGLNEGVVAVSEGREGGLESFQVVCRRRDARFGHDDNIDERAHVQQAGGRQKGDGGNTHENGQQEGKSEQKRGRGEGQEHQKNAVGEKRVVVVMVVVVVVVVVG
jgi:hypothetical protein